MMADQNPSSQKKTAVLVALAVLAIVLLAAVYWWFGLKSAKTPTAADSFKKAVDSAAGTLPTINPVTNPLEQMPDINAVQRSNPFTNIKTNPFQ